MYGEVHYTMNITRCVRCKHRHLYNTRCNTGWGLMLSHMPCVTNAKGRPATLGIQSCVRDEAVSQ